MAITSHLCSAGEGTQGFLCARQAPYGDTFLASQFTNLAVGVTVYHFQFLILAQEGFTIALKDSEGARCGGTNL